MNKSIEQRLDEVESILKDIRNTIVKDVPITTPVPEYESGKIYVAVRAKHEGYFSGVYFFVKYADHAGGAWHSFSQGFGNTYAGYCASPELALQVMSKEHTIYTCLTKTEAFEFMAKAQADYDSQ